MEQDLGGTLPGSRGGPAGFGLRLVGLSRLRRRGAQGVHSLVPLQEVALVPGCLRQHLHPALLVLLQASPELDALPFPLHFPEQAGGGWGETWDEGGAKRKKTQK